MPKHGSKPKSNPNKGSVFSVFKAKDLIERKRRRNEIALIETAPRGSKAKVLKEIKRGRKKK